MSEKKSRMGRGGERRGRRTLSPVQAKRACARKGERVALREQAWLPGYSLHEEQRSPCHSYHHTWPRCLSTTVCQSEDGEQAHQVVPCSYSALTSSRVRLADQQCERVEVKVSRQLRPEPKAMRWRTHRAAK